MLTFSGLLVAPDSGDYDEVRRVHNGLVDKWPALIARCLTAADVAAAVALGREEGGEISVRGGGHNVAGKAVTDGGLMIDLSLMKRTLVDPEAATITAGGGVTWRELNQAAHVHGLATTGGVVSTTGIAGLTLGGGVGWLMGKFAMAVDNVISAEVVLASGEVVTASQENEPDLFWAIRGGRGQLRGGDLFSVPGLPVADGAGRRRRASSARRPGGVGLLPGLQLVPA